MNCRRKRLWGSGLSLLSLVSILALSVALFLFCGGGLWQASIGASHLTRIALSYAVVVPLVGAALVLEKGFSVMRWVRATAFIWAVKMLLTVVLYGALAPGTSSRYRPASPWVKPVDGAEKTGTSRLRD